MENEEWKITFLENAPMLPFSSTDIREAMRSGQEHYRRNAWGEALNDFNRVLEMCPWHEQARQFVEMIQDILAFRYTDIYNP